ncbi:hypothetical protein ACFY5F_38320 [Streptomyces sp. NPDC013161]|uniref:hypothetical protein n=1 Tax=Streptomyces sp. NPDC013161 TaxID=3364862 RepID=UPI0036751DF1
MFRVRVFAGGALALVVLVVLAGAGCSADWGCTDTTTKRGEAGVKVRVEGVHGQLRGAAEVVDWRLEPHPQEPSRGDLVHFHFRFDGADEFNGPALDVCAVDKERVALGCGTVYSSQAFGPDGDTTGDDWLAVEHPSEVAGVLLIPNDQSYQGRTCGEDVKDGGGPHPPKPAARGDQL